MKKSGTRVPRVELEEMGPSFDMVIRREKLASDDLFRQASRLPKATQVCLEFFCLKNPLYSFQENVLCFRLGKSRIFRTTFLAPKWAGCMSSSRIWKRCKRARWRGWRERWRISPTKNTVLWNELEPINDKIWISVKKWTVCFHIFYCWFFVAVINFWMIWFYAGLSFYNIFNILYFLMLPTRKFNLQKIIRR